MLDHQRALEDALFVLAQIASDPHCDYNCSMLDQYAIGVADGHRCAAKKAKEFLDKIKELSQK